MGENKELKGEKEEDEKSSRADESEKGSEESGWECGFVEGVGAVEGEEVEVEDDVDLEDLAGEVPEDHDVRGKDAAVSSRY